MNKSALMEMKMYAQDKAPSKEQFLEEGLKYFKTSKKIEKAVQKAEAAFESKKSSMSPEDSKKVAAVIKRLKMAREEFNKIEESYSTGAGKEIAMKKYKLLRTKYADIFKSTSDLKKVLVGAGIFTAVGTAAYFLAQSIIPQETAKPGIQFKLFGMPLGAEKTTVPTDDMITKAMKSISSGTDGLLKAIGSIFSENKFAGDIEKFKAERQPGHIEGEFKGFK